MPYLAEGQREPRIRWLPDPRSPRGFRYPGEGRSDRRP